MNAGQRVRKMKRSHGYVALACKESSALQTYNSHDALNAHREGYVRYACHARNPRYPRYPRYGSGRNDVDRTLRYVCGIALTLRFTLDLEVLGKAMPGFMPSG